MAQQTAITKTAVEWFAEQAEKILIDLKKNNNTFQLELCLQKTGSEKAISLRPFYNDSKRGMPKDRRRFLGCY